MTDPQTRSPDPDEPQGAERVTVSGGFRTLDGNSNDYRYIQVRRTLIYIEQSIKHALDPFVFAVNDGTPVEEVVSRVTEILREAWSRGDLAGETPEEAFTVECDLSDGTLVVAVAVRVAERPEPVELTFRQREKAT